MEVRVLAGDLLRLVPGQRVLAQLGPPVELDEVRDAARVDQAEGVDAEAFHHPVAARQRAVRHQPHQRVRASRASARRSPRRCRARWRPAACSWCGSGLMRVHQVRELHRVLDEEHRHVVAHQVVVAFARVELDGEAAHVAHGVGRAARAQHGGEAHEHRRAAARPPAGSRPWCTRPAAGTARSSRAPPAPRACTTRSGMRSWSKWVIFSRRMKSSSSVGPRAPALQRVVVVGDAPRPGWWSAGSRAPGVKASSCFCLAAPASPALALRWRPCRDWAMDHSWVAAGPKARGAQAPRERVGFSSGLEVERGFEHAGQRGQRESAGAAGGAPDQPLGYRGDRSPWRFSFRMRCGPALSKQLCQAHGQRP